jgi:SAM-dependent methyltransferase
MSKVLTIADPNYVNTQYRDASNINARIRLHQEFSTNKYGWQRWLFDQFKFAPQSRVLELGCGAGNLWLENLDRIPTGLEIILSDLSAGMVAEAQRNLVNSPSCFQFKVIDAQAIPFEKDDFDVVIANHMLYHVPDRTKALSEIQCVLKPNGRFYASTASCNNLKELTDLVGQFDPQLSSWGKLPSNSFNLENGAVELSAYFSNVSLCRYPDSLMVTDATLLTDYILSGRINIALELQKELANFVSQALKAGGGKFFITKDSGVFEAKGTVKQ